MNNNKEIKKIKKKINKELVIKILLLVLLILLIGITSFKTGTKYYLLKNMNLDDNTPASVESGVARWYFNARIINKY